MVAFFLTMVSEGLSGKILNKHFPEAYLEPSRTSTMELFLAKIVNSPEPLTISKNTP